jgi:cholesterol oxidase
MSPAATADAYDFIVLGSGFGGSVSALRLAEKGYSVLVVEEGKRWRSEDFPRSNWNLRKSQWLPRLGCHGITRMDWLGDVLVLGGAGVGGGSLVYANTLLVPPAEAFAQGWPRPDMRERLAPHYETARRMLGATLPPRTWPAEEHLRDFGRALGREAHFSQPEVGILFGDKGGEVVADPYFGGRGPSRATCRLCGGCMVGCRHDAKNTLDKNYLYLAEQLGARILPETRAEAIEPDGQGGYVVLARGALGFRRKPQVRLRGRRVVVACGALGTVDLLLACRERGALPNLSPALGRHTRTNSEIICGARSRDGRVDHSQGIAIASDLRADADTHLQIVRYPAGSDLMGLLGTLAVDGGGSLPRRLRWIGQCLRHPPRSSAQPVAIRMGQAQRGGAGHAIARQRADAGAFAAELARSKVAQPAGRRCAAHADLFAHRQPSRPPRRPRHGRFRAQRHQRGRPLRAHHRAHPGRCPHGGDAR